MVVEGISAEMPADLIAEVTAWLDACDQREAVEGLPANPEAPGADEGIPAGLAQMEPGLHMAAVLASVELESLPGHDRVTVMAAHQRMASHHQARLYASMASVADAVEDALMADADLDMEYLEAACSAEIGSALRLTRRAADAELDMARRYHRRLPHVWEAFASGTIDRRRANLIVHRTDHLPQAEAREVADRALGRAPELTTGQLTALLRRLAVEADPGEAARRYEAAVDRRRVVLESTEDGTAHLHLYDLPPDRAARIRHGIDAIARSLRGDGEARSMDQLRADVALDILDPHAAPRPSRSQRGTIVLTVDLATLAGLTERAGDLGGYGPVVADIARQVAAGHDAEWRYVVTDTDGRALQVGTTRRRPRAKDRRLLEAAYPTCIFPGCRTPSTRCDLDHTIPHAEHGPTHPRNLAPLCRHHHRLRHLTGWRYRRTEEGDHEWVSPLGHRYRTPARAP